MGNLSMTISAEAPRIAQFEFRSKIIVRNSEGRKIENNIDPSLNTPYGDNHRSGAGVAS